METANSLSMANMSVTCASESQLSIVDCWALVTSTSPGRSSVARTICCSLASACSVMVCLENSPPSKHLVGSTIAAHQPPGRELRRPARAARAVAVEEVHVSRQRHIHLPPQEACDGAMARAAQDRVAVALAGCPLHCRQQRETDSMTLRGIYEIGNRGHPGTVQTRVARFPRLE